MNLSAMKEVVWSEEAQSCKDIMKDHPAPLLVRVEQGYCSEEDGESLGQGQIIRIAKWLTQQRIIAKDSGGRHFSFPIQFPVPFEVFSDKKRTLRRKRPKTLADIARDHKLPKKVMMKASNAKSQEFAIASAFGNEPLELLRIHEEIYLHGNAVNYGSIDPTVINIPTHASLELKVGQGLTNANEAEWNKLLRDLDDIIAKEAQYEPTRGNQKILVYMPSKNDEDADDILVADVPRSLSSTDDDGPDDVLRAFDGDDEPDRDSTGGSASGTSLSYSAGSTEILNGDAASVDSAHGQNNNHGVADNMVDFTSYTQQRTSFMLEHGGMAPPNGRPALDLDGFFNSREDQGSNAEDNHPGERSIFQSNVSKLSLFRPEHWGFATPDQAPQETDLTQSRQPQPQQQQQGGGNVEGKTYTKFKNLTISKQARKFRNKLENIKSSQSTTTKSSSSQGQAKDLAPKQRLRRLSALPPDIYSLTAQQVLDLLKLLDLSEFAPMFAFDRIDGRVLSKLTSDELVTKYGMTEEQASKLLAHVDRKDLSKADNRLLTSYQTTNGALDVDYRQKRTTDINLTARYF